MKKTHKIIGVVLVIIAVGLLARFVVFKTQFDNWGTGLERIDSWQEDYMTAHPNATKEDMKRDFDTSMANLKEWEDAYKSTHPGATSAEVDAAFNAQWDK